MLMKQYKDICSASVQWNLFRSFFSRLYVTVYYNEITIEITSMVFR